MNEVRSGATSRISIHPAFGDENLQYSCDADTYGKIVQRQRTHPWVSDRAWTQSWGRSVRSPPPSLLLAFVQKESKESQPPLYHSQDMMSLYVFRFPSLLLLCLTCVFTLARGIWPGAVPLAVRSPYLNVWQASTSTNDNPVFWDGSVSR